MASQKKSKKDKNAKKGLRAIYVKVDSLADLGRRVAGSHSFLLAVKLSGTYRLIAEGEHIGDGRMAYYFESKKLSRYLVYSAEEERGEIVELIDSVAERNDHYKSQRFPIIEIEKDPYLPLDIKKPDATVVESKDYGTMVRGLVGELEDHSTPILYSFMQGKERVVCSMDLMHDHTKVLVYAKMKDKSQFKTISYDYTSDTMEPTNIIGWASKIQIKVVNLAEPLPGFK